jgi:hypothetical protein
MLLESIEIYLTKNYSVTRDGLHAANVSKRVCNAPVIPDKPSSSTMETRVRPLDPLQLEQTQAMLH